MNDLRDQLEHAGDRFRLPPGALQRMHGRRVRRQRNRRVLSGIVAVAVAGAGIWGLFRALNPSRQVRSASVTEVARLNAEPSAIAVGAGGVWVAADEGLTRIDQSNGSATPIPIPELLGQPVSVQVARGSVWVHTGQIGGDLSTSQAQPHITSAAVVRIDPASGEVISSFDLPGNVSVPVSIGGGAVWSVTSGGLVSRRRLEDGQVTGKVRAQSAPVAITYGEGHVWVLADGRSRLIPDTLTSSPEGEEIRISDPGRLTAIDPERVTVVEHVVVGVNRALATGAGGVWMANSQSDAIIRVDPGGSTVIEVITLPSPATEISAGSEGVWVLMPDRETAARVEAGELAHPAIVGPGAVAMAQGDGSLWVARADGTILRIG